MMSALVCAAFCANPVESGLSFAARLGVGIGLGAGIGVGKGNGVGEGPGVGDGEGKGRTLVPSILQPVTEIQNIKKSKYIVLESRGLRQLLKKISGQPAALFMEWR